jgi:hypothetical protein
LMGTIHGHGRIVRDSPTLPDIYLRHADKHLMEIGHISSYIYSLTR